MTSKAHCNTDGRRGVLGLEVGPSEAEPFWTAFLRSLTRRGLRGVKLVISDSHEGLKKAAAKVLSATWQRCRVGSLKKSVLASPLHEPGKAQPDHSDDPQARPRRIAAA
jgi:transposase-like protein